VLTIAALQHSAALQHRGGGVGAVMIILLILSVFLHRQYRSMKSVLESVHCEGLSRHYTVRSEKSIKDLTN
jgi:hypothetical protein